MINTMIDHVVIANDAIGLLNISEVAQRFGNDRRRELNISD